MYGREGEGLILREGGRRGQTRRQLTEGPFPSCSDSQDDHAPADPSWWIRSLSLASCCWQRVVVVVVVGVMKGWCGGDDGGWGVVVVMKGWG